MSCLSLTFGALLFRGLILDVRVTLGDLLSVHLIFERVFFCMAFWALFNPFGIVLFNRLLKHVFLFISFFEGGRFFFEVVLIFSALQVGLVVQIDFVFIRELSSRYSVPIMLLTVLLFFLLISAGVFVREIRILAGRFFVRLLLTEAWLFLLFELFISILKWVVIIFVLAVLSLTVFGLAMLLFLFFVRFFISFIFKVWWFVLVDIFLKHWARGFICFEFLNFLVQHFWWRNLFQQWHIELWSRFFLSCAFFWRGTKHSLGFKWFCEEQSPHSLAQDLFKRAALLLLC